MTKRILICSVLFLVVFGWPWNWTRHFVDMLIYGFALYGLWNAAQILWDAIGRDLEMREVDEQYKEQQRLRDETNKELERMYPKKEGKP